MSKSYTITDLHDLAMVATPENLDNLMADLKIWLEYGIAHRGGTKIPGLGTLKFDYTKFNWIDDGAVGLSGVNIQVKND